MIRYEKIFCWALVVIGLTINSGCKDRQEIEHSENVSLSVVTVSVREVLAERAVYQTEVVGTVQAVERTVIAAKLGGHIVEMPVVLGSRVKKGDLLVRIVAGEISAQVLQAKIQLEQAKRNLEREKKLLLRDATTQEAVKSLEDMERMASAAYEETQVMLSYTVIFAPFDGLITSKIANVGDLATPGLPLVHLENDAALQVIAEVPEAIVINVREGDILPVKIPSASVDFNGRIAEVAPTADPLSRTASIKLDIPSDPKIRTGQFARVYLAEPGELTLMVPREAVIAFGQMERVFTVENDKARLRLVRTGAVVNGKIEILSGLDSGDVLVVKGATKLLDGQPLSIER